MKLILTSSEFVHVPLTSAYNHNNYRNIKDKSITINEICHEDDNFFQYTLIQHGIRTFLGCSETKTGLGNDGNNEIEIDFLEYYT